MGTLDREGALDSLTKVIAAVKEAIEKSSGNFVVKMEPKVVTDTDEAELSKELARLEQMNAEVDGTIQRTKMMKMVLVMTTKRKERVERKARTKKRSLLKMEKRENYIVGSENNIVKV